MQARSSWPWSGERTQCESWSLGISTLPQDHSQTLIRSSNLVWDPHRLALLSLCHIKIKIRVCKSFYLSIKKKVSVCCFLVQTYFSLFLQYFEFSKSRSGWFMKTSRKFWYSGMQWNCYITLQIDSMFSIFLWKPPNHGLVRGLLSCNFSPNHDLKFLKEKSNMLLISIWNTSKMLEF